MKRASATLLLAGMAVALMSTAVFAQPRINVVERHARLRPMVTMPPTLGFDNRLRPFPNGPFVREPLYFPPSGIFFGHYPPDRIIHPANPPFFNFHQPPFRAPISPPSVVFPPGERLGIIVIQPNMNGMGGSWWW